MYSGAGLIAWTAGEMIDSDAAARPWLPRLFHETYWLPLCLTAIVIGYGWWRTRRAGRKSRDVLAADIHAAQRIEDKID